jgi:aryl-alcohol dehydrogenase-like predicted oxidoreductase
MALRYILCNPAITAPIPGMIAPEQVDNAALAVKERRELDMQEKAELERASERAWANLPYNYRWLKDWEYV